MNSPVQGQGAAIPRPVLGIEPTETSEATYARLPSPTGQPLFTKVRKHTF